MNLLITGANGFVGTSLVQHLLAGGHGITAQVRSLQRLAWSSELPSKKEPSTQHLQALEADFTDISGFQQTLRGCEALVHCAARVHQVQDNASDPLAAYRRDNRDATLALARLAAQDGVQRFVLLSSVKVNGEFTQHGQPFRAQDATPQDPYAISKWEAEQGLLEIAAKTGMEVVIIRPPLVYGPGVKANFLTMMQWLHRGIPLPFGAINNRRSLVALPNLVDFITLCLTHPKAANRTFLISDQQDLSTTQLLRGLGDALHRPARLLPVPQHVLELGLKAVGKGDVAQRLCGSLTVDSSPATELLGWKPPLTVQQGLQLTADHFLKQQASKP
ncbi:MAG: SDR family oxidoreductase [Burkholderiales bacterium]|nr:MAG: SDR family oxidoreductase [Burkholderiales bacterium]